MKGADLAGTVATARVEITDWQGYDFTDQFTLLKEDGAWKVRSSHWSAVLGGSGTTQTSLQQDD